MQVGGGGITSSSAARASYRSHAVTARVLEASGVVGEVRVQAWVAMWVAGRVRVGRTVLSVCDLPCELALLLHTASRGGWYRGS